MNKLVAEVDDPLVGYSVESAHTQDDQALEVVLPGVVEAEVYHLTVC